MSHYNEADPTFKRSDRSKPAIPAIRGHDFATQPEDGRVGSQSCHYNPTNRDDESDDDYLPPLEEVFQTRFPSKASAKPLKPERNQQHGKEPTPDATGTHIDHAILGLGDRLGRSQDQPVIIEDDESDSTDAETEAETTPSADIESSSLERDTTLRGIGAAQDPTSEKIFLGPGLRAGMDVRPAVGKCNIESVWGGGIRD